MPVAASKPARPLRYPPRRPRGRVLHIGASFYNNWYVSRELRKHGWVADTFVTASEGSDLYIHGSDYYLDSHDHLVHDVARPDLAAFFRSVADEYLGCIGTGRPPRHGVSGGRSVRRLLRELRAAARRSDLDADARDLLFRRVTEPLLVETNRRKLRALFGAFLRLLCPEPVPSLHPIAEIVDRYDVIHFTGVNSMRLLYFIAPSLFGSMPIGWDVDVLKRLGKKIVYTSIGCLDGVTQTSFRRWGPHTVCDICRWHDEPSVCSDDRNRRWGILRNHLADYVILVGGNHVDFNDNGIVHEVPEFYCLDPEFWSPGIEIPVEHRVDTPPGTVKIYHAVGEYDMRTRPESRVNIKTTHIIVPTVERLKAEGYPVELVFCTGLPNKTVRYYQLQSDIVVDMLTFGFFGANVREAMMLGKPAVCYLRPEWLDSMRGELPDYVDELPVVSATPETIHDVLIDLVNDPDRRADLGRRGRAFARRWHSPGAGARRLAAIYDGLLAP